MKKSSSAAISTKLWLSQQYVNEPIQATESMGPMKASNMSDWFEMVSFEILGEMASGESNHCIEFY